MFIRRSLLFFIMYRYDEVNTIRDSDHTPLYGAVCLRIGPNCNAGPTTNHVLVSFPFHVDYSIYLPY